MTPLRESLGFGVWGLGFGVWGLGLGIWGLEFGDGRSPLIHKAWQHTIELISRVKIIEYEVVESGDESWGPF